MDRVYVMQLVRSFQVGELTRRDFMRRATAALGSTAAAATLLSACKPITAEVPRAVIEAPAAAHDAPLASAQGLETGSITYPDSADAESLQGYLARPASGGAAPAVIVLQEWWGLNAHIKDVTNRFAQAGYVALAPDLYHGAVTTEPDEARKLVMELDMHEAIREIQQAVTYLLEQDFVSTSKVGIVGFCMGGRLSLMASITESRLGATVAFYGTPLPPDQAAQVQSPVLGLYGEADSGISVESVRGMESAFAEAGIEHEIVVYPGAAHAFFNDTRQSAYSSEAAADAWQRTLDWFEKHLA
jgi:carboxymethylenebutenolidase